MKPRLRAYIKKAERYYKEHSERKFYDIDDAYDYLNREVFKEKEFINNVSEAAEYSKVSYLVAYEVITNQLTNILYEIDKKKASRRTLSTINVFAYLRIEIGFGHNINRNYLRDEILEHHAKNNKNYK